MSVLNIAEHLKGNWKAEDLMIRGNPPHPLYSLKIQEGDKHRTFKRWYICTQGMGMSLETAEDLQPGKWLENHIEEMLGDKVYIESSSRKTFSISPALRKLLKCPDGYGVGKCREGIWGLYFSPASHGQGAKLIKPFPEGVGMRCLEAILYHDRNDSPMPVPYNDLGAITQDKLVAALRDTLKLESWPDGQQYTDFDYNGMVVRITMTDHINILAGDVY